MIYYFQRADGFPFRRLTQGSRFQLVGLDCVALWGGELIASPSSVWLAYLAQFSSLCLLNLRFATSSRKLVVVVAAACRVWRWKNTATVGLKAATDRLCRLVSQWVSQLSSCQTRFHKERNATTLRRFFGITSSQLRASRLLSCVCEWVSGFLYLLALVSLCASIHPFGLPVAKWMDVQLAWAIQ